MLKSIIALLALVSAPVFAADSVYTSVEKDDCVTIEDSENDPDAEIDYYTGICDGKGGYQVQVSGGDLRYGPSLMYSGQVIENLYDITSFHNMGSSKVEWRFEIQNGRKVYTAMIFRIAHHETSSLFVVRLDGPKSCTIAHIVSSENMNEIARAFADNAGDFSCMW